MGRGRVLAGALVGALTAGVTAYAAYQTLRTNPPGGRARWERTNHRGAPVTLVLGPAAAAGTAVGAAITPGAAGRERFALVLAVTGSGLVGWYDDATGNPTTKGLRGHLAALRRGELTSGLVKLVGIGGSGLAAAAALRDRKAHPLLVVADGALIAGTANLVNLFDLRPGRAGKAVLLASVSALPSRALLLAAAPAGAVSALLPDDLDESGMLGDSGANALGAALGVAAVAGAPPRVRLALLGVVTALTAASERVSFTAVIDRTPALRWIDRYGRPAEAPSPERLGERARAETRQSPHHRGARVESNAPMNPE